MQEPRIEIHPHFKEIRLYETGRVSAIWEAYTPTNQDALRWALLALPSSGSKREAVTHWLAGHKDRVQKLQEQLKQEGLVLEEKI